MSNEQLSEEFYLLSRADRDKLMVVQDKIYVKDPDLSEGGQTFLEAWHDHVLVCIGLDTLVDIYAESYGQSKALEVPSLFKLMKQLNFGMIRALFTERRLMLREEGVNVPFEQTSQQKIDMVDNLVSYLKEVMTSHVRPCSSQGETPGIQFKDLIRAINAVALDSGFKGILASTRNVSEVIAFYNFTATKPIQIGIHKQLKWVLDLELSIDKKDGKIYEEFMKGIKASNNPRKNLGKAIADNIERLEAHDKT